MATTIRKTAYFSMQTHNRAGQAAQLLDNLAGHGVDLLAFTGFPNEAGAQLDFIPYDVAKFTRAARKLDLNVGEKITVFLAQGFRTQRTCVADAFLDTLPGFGDIAGMGKAISPSGDMPKNRVPQPY